MKPGAWTGEATAGLILPYIVAVAAVAFVLAAVAVRCVEVSRSILAESSVELGIACSRLADMAATGGGEGLDTLSVFPGGACLSPDWKAAPVSMPVRALVVISTSCRPSAGQPDDFVTLDGGLLRAVSRRGTVDGRSVRAVAEAPAPDALGLLEATRSVLLPGLFVAACILSMPVVFLMHISMRRRRLELERFESPPREELRKPSREESRPECGAALDRSVVDAGGPFGLVLTDAEFRIVSMNRSAEDLLDGTLAEFHGFGLGSIPSLGPLDPGLSGDPGFWRSASLDCRQAGGRTLKLRIACTPVGTGEGARMLCLLTDVTDLEEVKSEKKKLLEREMAVNSYAVLAAMVRGFSHDLNNLLSGIIGAASLGDAMHESGTPDRQRYEAILAAAERSAAISEELLQSASLSETQARPLDTARELEEIAEALRSVLPRTISLEVSLSDDLSFVLADRSLLRQVLYNLALKSSSSLQGTGRIRLRAEDVKNPAADPRFTSVCRSLGGIHSVSISISDGTSLPVGLQKVLSSADSDPYEIEKTYGAGMAAVQQAVRALKGVLCFSPDQRGTVMRVLLPAAERVAQPSTGKLLTGLGVSVLIAEEEGIVRETTAQILAHFGFRTAEVSSGDEALAVLDHEGFDALVLDLGTFGTPSMAVAEICTERWPHMAILFTSGYELPGDVASFLSTRTGAGFLRKPYFPDAVAAEVVRLVSAGRTPAQGGAG